MRTIKTYSKGRPFIMRFSGVIAAAKSRLATAQLYISGDLSFEHLERDVTGIEHRVVKLLKRKLVPECPFCFVTEFHNL